MKINETITMEGIKLTTTSKQWYHDSSEYDLWLQEARSEDGKDYTLIWPDGNDPDGKPVGLTLEK